MNRRELIKKGIVLGIAATVILGMIPSQSQASAADALEYLLWLVSHFNLQAGISNSLDAKIDAALNALDDINENNNVAAINSMDAFINAVEAQRDKFLTDEEANTLVLRANEVIDILEGCVHGDCDIPDCTCEPPCVLPCDGTGGGSGGGA
jgi:hypothetical protein